MSVLIIVALNSCFVEFSHDDTFRNGIKSDLYMGFTVGLMGFNVTYKI